MNFQQLEYIIAIDEHKLFSEAAFSCEVTQATLSAMVIKLEKEVGFLIFDRTTKPVTTTELGVELISMAKEILGVKNSIAYLGKQMPKSLSGELTVGVIPTIAKSLLSKILPEILRLNPGLQLKIREVTTQEIIRNLKLGSMDIGIAATPLNDKNIDEEILYYEPMLVYGIDETSKEYIVSKELLDNKIWLLEEDHCFSGQVATVCGLKKKETEIENLSFEGNSFETLLSMVDVFGGYTLIPELYYLDMDKKLKQKCRMFQKPIPVREISLLSYGPSHKNLTKTYLAHLIKQKVQPLLSTSRYKNKDLMMVEVS